jgi:uncharacterized protein (TIGR02145 family)
MKKFLTFNFLCGQNMFCLLLLFALFSAASLHAQKTNFVRDYTYQAGEADSKLTARANATNEMRSILLREVGQFLHSEITLMRNDTSEYFAEKIKAVTAGIIEMKTLDEQWNGATYYIQAEMTVDPAEVHRRIEEILNDKQRTKEMEDARKRMLAAEAEVERLRKELAGSGNRNNQALRAAYEYQTGILAANDYITRGNIALNYDWQEDALAEYDKACAQMPDNEATHLFMGEVYGKVKTREGYSRSLAHYDKACAQMPNNEATHLFMGEVYYNMKTSEGYSRAMACYDNYLKTKPDDGEILMLAGDVCRNIAGCAYKNYYHSAERRYKQMIMGDPRNFAAHIKLAELAFKQGGDGSRYVTKAIEIDPNNEAWRLTDTRDHKTYKVRLMPDGKWWFAENLRYTDGLTWNRQSNMANGVPFTSTDNGVPAIGSYWCPAKDNTAATPDQRSCDVYGALYTWETAMMVDGKWSDEAKTSSAWKESGASDNVKVNNARGGRGICPAGWHVPTDDEWTALLDAVKDDAGVKLKSTATYSGDDPGNGTWRDDTNRGTDTYGFRVLPSGYRANNGSYFGNRGVHARYWSSSAYSGTNAWNRAFNHNEARVNRNDYARSLGFSVRCIRD